MRDVVDYGRRSKLGLILLALLACRGSALAQESDLSLDQQLILACFRLQAHKVADCLRKGANVNAVFGHTNELTLFGDPWRGGLPIGSNKWTPLMALASSPSEPPPPWGYNRAELSLMQQIEAIERVPAEQIAQREAIAVTICHILYSHNCDLEPDDGFGATAVFMAADRKRSDLLRQLLKYGADPNVKVRVYIDGPGDLTPLHHAIPSFEAMQLLLDYGADPEARDTTGKTPADWLNLTDSGFKLVKTPTNGWRLQATD